MSTKAVHTYVYRSGYDTTETVEFNVRNILLESSKPFRSRAWSYSLGIRNIADARLKAREVEMEVAFVPMTGDKDGYSDADRFRHIVDRDVYMRTPGTLTVDGKWTQRCYVVGHKANDNVVGGAHKGTDTFVLLDGYWWNLVHASEIEGVDVSTDEIVGGFDYPHDYPHDYAYSKTGENKNRIVVNSYIPSDVCIEVKGPATGPISMTIGRNTYRVNTSLVDGERLTIDGREKLIYVTTESNGQSRSVFDKGVRGSGKGSGSYVFEPLNPGTYEVTYSGMTRFSVGWYEMDTEPPWSL